MTLRPLRPEDRDIELAFVSGLSAETRHNRLLGGAIAITREYIERLISVDFSRDMALAATAHAGWRRASSAWRATCATRTATPRSSPSCVADAWHGRGIGSRLLGKLIEAARGHGVKRLHGEILAMNRPMLGLVTKLGFELSRHEDRDLTRAVLTCVAKAGPRA